MRTRWLDGALRALILPVGIMSFLPDPSLALAQKVPVAKLVSYEGEFRKNFGKTYHLSLVVYFEHRNISDSYNVKYGIKAKKSGRVYEGEAKYVSPSPCELGYTGAQSILDAPSGYGFFGEIVLRAKQTPVRPSGNSPKPIKQGTWWITEGIDLPSFNHLDYTIESVDIVETKTNGARWQLH